MSSISNVAVSSTSSSSRSAMVVHLLPGRVGAAAGPAAEPGEAVPRSAGTAAAAAGTPAAARRAAGGAARRTGARAAPAGSVLPDVGDLLHLEGGGLQGQQLGGQVGHHDSFASGAAVRKSRTRATDVTPARSGGGEVDRRGPAIRSGELRQDQLVAGGRRSARPPRRPDRPRPRRRGPRPARQPVIRPGERRTGQLAFADRCQQRCLGSCTQEDADRATSCGSRSVADGNYSDRYDPATEPEGRPDRRPRRVR